MLAFQNEDFENSSKIANLSRSLRKAAPYFNLVYVWIASMLMLGGLGWLGDAYYNTKPILTIFGILGGLGLGFYSFFKTLKKLEK